MRRVVLERRFFAPRCENPLISRPSYRGVNLSMKLRTSLTQKCWWDERWSLFLSTKKRVPHSFSSRSNDSFIVSFHEEMIFSRFLLTKQQFIVQTSLKVGRCSLCRCNTSATQDASSSSRPWWKIQNIEKNQKSSPRTHQLVSGRAAKSRYRWYRRYKEAKWFERKKCLFSLLRGRFR